MSPEVDKGQEKADVVEFTLAENPEIRTLRGKGEMFGNLCVSEGR